MCNQGEIILAIGAKCGDLIVSVLNEQCLHI